MMPVHMAVQQHLQSFGVLVRPIGRVQGAQSRVLNGFCRLGFQFVMPPIERGYGLMVVGVIRSLAPFAV